MTAVASCATSAHNNNADTDTDTDSPIATSTATTSTTTAAVELSENFYINSSNRRQHNLKIQVKLNGSGLYLRREADERNRNEPPPEQLIRLEDIVGSCCGPRPKKHGSHGGLTSCKCQRDDEQHHHSELSAAAPVATPRDSKDTSAYLYIYAYVLREKPRLRRMRTVRILCFRSYVKYEENLRAAERWHHAITMNKSRGEQRPQKPMLILLNPKSGSGKGRELFQRQVAPVLKEADVPYELVVTAHANFARELVRQRKDIVHHYGGIVVASGDGLFHEVLNGIMDRTDWRSLARHLPLGVIPCGSGNGLAKSIAHNYGQPYETDPILNATLACVSAHSTPLDVVRVELAHTGRHAAMYSVLSIGWGFIADIDIESERLRSLGAPRFTLWSIHRLINLRTHKGRLSYLPWRRDGQTAPGSAGSAAPSTPRQRQHQQRPTNDDDVAEEAIFVDALGEIDGERDGGGDGHDDDDNDDDEDVFVDAISLDRFSNRPQVDSWHSATSRRTAFYSVAGQSVRSHHSLSASVLSKIEAAQAELEACAPQSTIPPLQLPLPNTWHCEEGDFVMVQAAYTTHLSADCYFAPGSHLNDGIINLVIIRAGVGRSQLLQFLLNMSSGTHLPDTPNTHIQLVPVRAFRIEPLDSDGIMTVDGERIDYGPIQAEIFPGLIQVMVPNVAGPH